MKEETKDWIDGHGRRLPLEERERTLDRVIAHLEGLGDTQTVAPTRTGAGMVAGREAITTKARRDYLDLATRAFMSICASGVIMVVGLLAYTAAGGVFNAGVNEPLVVAVMTMGAALSGLVYYLLGTEPIF